SGAGRRSAPDEVWAAARDDYLSGLSAPEVCRRHGVGVTALRARAAREGWRRMDQPWAPPNRLDPFDEGVDLEQQLDGDLDRIEPGQLAWVAHRRMMRAVLRGDAGEAMRWRRVELMVAETDEELRYFIAEEEAYERRLAAYAAEAAAFAAA